MKTSFALAAGLIAGIGLLLAAAPAAAGDRVHWSVTIGAHGHAAPPVAVYPQPHYNYSYGAPSHAPPVVIYVPVQPVYQQSYGNHVRHERHHHHERQWRYGPSASERGNGWGHGGRRH